MLCLAHSTAMESSSPVTTASTTVPLGGWDPLYDQMVATLRAVGAGDEAPQVGDCFPDYALPDERGNFYSLSGLADAGPLVLSFNRGGWCPYCRAEVADWSDHADGLARHGARLVVVTGETSGQQRRLRQIAPNDSVFLCDVDHGAALANGLAFRCSQELRAEYLAAGLDLADFYGGSGWILPIPALFVLDSALTVRYRFVDADFRRRAPAQQVLEALA